ncbi:MAG: NAD-dependent epimerase/dehydratase family protein [Myxococcales bacterium]|nr:NAD-dependent epimerase/dehydratase family protein [Myxococcales bacterium]
MRVFITGGSGFIGGHIIERLAGAHTVLAMARSARSAEVVRGFGARPVDCALDTLTAEHLAGVDAVVHAAALVAEWGEANRFATTNVDGTEHVLRAARAAGVSRFIHLSSEAVVFDGQDLVDIDETYAGPASHRYGYCASKADAERCVRSANAADFATIALRPSLVWGPRDATLMPTLVEMAARHRFVWIRGGRLLVSTAHVQNVAHAVELALTRGVGGEAYFIADAERGTTRDFFTGLMATQGVTLPDRSIPPSLARAMAATLAAIWRLFRLRGQPPITPLAAAVLSTAVSLRTEKAARELGYAPIIDWERGFAGLA